MANIIKVRVAKVSTTASKNGNFIHTLKFEGKSAVILGQTKTSGALTYFVALPAAAALNSEHNIDLDQFSITEREMADSTTGEVVKDDRGNAIKLKWLSVK